MIRGVIFDLDGVLVSTDELHYKAWKKLADNLGIVNFTRVDNERQRGVSRMESLDIVLEKSDYHFDNKMKVSLAEEKNNYYKDFLEELDEKAVLTGAEETLKNLRARNIIIGVGSASKNTPEILKKTGLLKYIDKVSCGLDVTKSKPDPEVFLVAAKKMNLKPEECLVVEDSAAGVIAAKAAKMKSLGVGPFHNLLSADYHRENLADDIDWETIIQQK